MSMRSNSSPITTIKTEPRRWSSGFSLLRLRARFLPTRTVLDVRLTRLRSRFLIRRTFVDVHLSRLKPELQLRTVGVSARNRWTHPTKSEILFFKSEIRNPKSEIANGDLEFS